MLASDVRHAAGALVAGLVMRQCREELTAFIIGVVLRCVDLHALCFGWAARGECDRLPGFMRAECPAACGLCAGYAPADQGRHRLWRTEGMVSLPLPRHGL